MDDELRAYDARWKEAARKKIAENNEELEITRFWNDYTAEKKRKRKSYDAFRGIK